ncbi:hypothetical protein [Marinobacter sp.]|jgi:hypothetical protein|uniref:hypothetical protein n=1 Tax=Marinobacter sp. TaxID=50741 RepID=UPI0023542A78|nr:hypothetical protein [Marinobacter sp.]|tara:strand:- start:944 stop:1243 length:300 start_codon:yes stop_codon:yes gene_type:complete
MGIHEYSVVETGNVGLGQAGSLLETGTTAITGKTIVAISFLEDTVFTTLTPESGTNLYLGDSNNNGDTSDSITFPQGMTIYGRWSAFTLASGKVVGYLG